MDYFSDKERGPRPRSEEEITPEAWGGIIALIHSLISTGLIQQEKDCCPDTIPGIRAGGGISGIPVG